MASRCLRRHGLELIVADCRKVIAFSLNYDNTKIEAREDWEVKLPYQAAAIADTDAGVLVACNVRDRTELVLVDHGVLSNVTGISGIISSFTSSRREAFVATKQANTLVGCLWQIDIAAIPHCGFSKLNLISNQHVSIQISQRRNQRFPLTFSKMVLATRECRECSRSKKFQSNRSSIPVFSGESKA